MKLAFNNSGIIFIQRGESIGKKRLEEIYDVAKKLDLQIIMEEVLQELLADGGYSSGEALAYLHEKNINAYIPNFGQYKSEREGFMFHKEENYYQCTKPEGKQANKYTIVTGKQIVKTVH